MFDLFQELFAPGRKHTHDERRRLELTRVDVADGDPGRGPIDLASGTVVIRLPGARPEDGSGAPDGPAPDGPAPDRRHAPDGPREADTPQDTP